MTRARAEPASLVVGLDADAAGMAEASRRAAGPARKGGLPNALFVVAAAEAPPPELAGLFDVVTVNLPWASLLRGALAMDTRAAAGIAALVAPAGRVEMLLAPSARDRLDGIGDLEARLDGTLEAAWACHGLAVVEARPATPGELAATPSTWARRLGLGSRHAPADRRAWRVILARNPSDMTTR